MQRFLELTDPYSVEPVILVEDSHSPALTTIWQFRPHCDGRYVVVPTETTRLRGRTVCSVLVYVLGTQLMVERKKPFSWVEMLVSKVALLGLCAFLVKMRTSPKPTRAPTLAPDEDLNDGSNSGAEL